MAGFLGLNALYRGDIAAARRAFHESDRMGQHVGNLVIAELAQLEGTLGLAMTLFT